MINSITDIYSGINLLYLNNLYNVEFVDFIKPGKGHPFIRVKLRNLFNKKLIEKVFKNTNSLKKVDIKSFYYIYLYNNEMFWFFLNKSTLEQICLKKKIIKNSIKWFQEGYIYKILFWKRLPINVIIPNFVYISVVNDFFSLKGNTIKNSSKKVLLSTGFYIKVPFFIKSGDIIKIDTRNNLYVSRK